MITILAIIGFLELTVSGNLKEFSTNTGTKSSPLQASSPGGIMFNVTNMAGSNFHSRNKT